MSFEQQKQQIIQWAKTLSEKSLVCARSGNISYKMGEDKFLVTAHDSYLGFLEENDILLVNSQGKIISGEGKITSEQELHIGIYQKFAEARIVIHAHSPYTTAFFHYHDSLEVFSFETKFYLGNIKAIPQETPTVTNLKPVLGALEGNRIVVLKNHGVVAMGGNFKETYSLIELLEEQAKVNLLVKGQATEPVVETEKARQPQPINKKYRMLSAEHGQALADLVNGDDEVRRLGEKYGLTCTLAVKSQDTGAAMRFHYDKGRVVKVDSEDQGDFVIIGKEDILRKVFNRQIDPFVASTQGRVKTKGDFSKMSRWYPVMVKTFKLWEQAPVE